MKKETVEDIDNSLTEEQKKAETAWELPDDIIARYAKAISEKLNVTDIDGFKGIMSMAACLTLIEFAHQSNSETFTQEISGYSKKSNPNEKSDWRITIEKLNP